MTGQKWPFVFFFLGLFLSTSYVSAGTILSSYKYGWSNNVGYINFENVTVTDSALSGYAWSANSGWIKFNPAQGGVLNDGTGNLSGSAWGSDLGWIDFNDVSINPTTGEFSGTATGALVGTITFDCPNYCDVRTDWRQATTPSIVPSGGGVAIIPNSVSKQTQTQGTSKVCTDVSNKALTIQSNRATKLVKDTPIGSATFEIPAVKLEKNLTLDQIIEPITKVNTYMVPESTEIVGGLMYNIILKNEDCASVYFVSVPTTISLPIPNNVTDTKKIGAYWFNETNQSWVLIPGAVIRKNKVVIATNNVGKFTLFVLKNTELQKTKLKTAQTAQVASLPVGKKIEIGKKNKEIDQQKDIVLEQSQRNFIKMAIDFLISVFHSISFFR